MCSACGVLNGGSDWLERAENPDGIGSEENVTRRAERQNLINMVNILLAPSRVKLCDFNTNLIVKGPTGQTKIVSDLAHVWVMADTIGMRIVDPLDKEYLYEIGLQKE